ncbi:MAG: T9SS type A sorting domain-containing protein [Bacteroidales bacterium]|nr:T9SS type A sorting domain-containing protein [Bacteroidales bacterium]
MKSKAFLLILLTLTILNSFLGAQSFTNYTTDNGLPDNNVNGVAVDGNNVKWFGTQLGVARFDGSNWSIFTTANGLIDNYINCIAVDANNHIWIGTDIGVSVYDGSAWTSYTTANGLIDNMISYIAGADDGSVWIGTNLGLSKFNSGTFTNYNSSNGLNYEMVSYIATQGTNVWIGTWLGGVFKFDGTTFTNFTMANGLPDNNISCIAIDDAGNKFIGTFAGIAKLNSSDVYVTTYTSTGGMFNNYVKDLAITSDQDLWAGIYADYLQEGAISFFNQSSWVNYKVSDGLVNTMVKRVAIDANDHLWVATGSGVSEFNPLTGIGEQTASGISVYPNPATDVLHIDGISESANVAVYNSCGKLVMAQNMTGQDGNVDISGNTLGFYVVKVMDKSRSITAKIMIK